MTSRCPAFSLKKPACVLTILPAYKDLYRLDKEITCAISLRRDKPLFLSAAVILFPKSAFVLLFSENCFCFRVVFFVQTRDFDRIIFKKGVYCPMRCTQRPLAERIFPRAIDS